MSSRNRRDDVEAGEGDQFLRKSDEEQEKHLEVIGSALKRVGDMAQSFGDELRQQNTMLDDVGGSMDRTQNAMKLVEGKTQEMVEKAGGPGWFCLIAVLSGVALFLFLMVVYT